MIARKVNQKWFGLRNLAVIGLSMFTVLASSSVAQQGKVIEEALTTLKQMEALSKKSHAEFLEKLNSLPDDQQLLVTNQLTKLEGAKNFQKAFGNNSHSSEMSFSWMMALPNHKSQIATLHRDGELVLAGTEDDHGKDYVTNRLSAIGAMYALGEKIDTEVISSSEGPFRDSHSTVRIKLRDFQGPFKSEGFRELLKLGTFESADFGRTFNSEVNSSVRVESSHGRAISPQQDEQRAQGNESSEKKIELGFRVFGSESTLLGEPAPKLSARDLSDAALEGDKTAKSLRITPDNEKITDIKRLKANSKTVIIELKPTDEASFAFTDIGHFEFPTEMAAAKFVAAIRFPTVEFEILLDQDSEYFSDRYLEASPSDLFLSGTHSAGALFIRVKGSQKGMTAREFIGKVTDPDSVLYNPKVESTARRLLENQSLLTRVDERLSSSYEPSVGSYEIANKRPGIVAVGTSEALAGIGATAYGLNCIKESKWKGLGFAGLGVGLIGDAIYKIRANEKYLDASYIPLKDLLYTAPKGMIKGTYTDGSVEDSECISEQALSDLREKQVSGSANELRTDSRNSSDERSHGQKAK